MSRDTEWGPWVAHETNGMPEDVDGKEVEVRRIDLSDIYLPDGFYDGCVLADGKDGVWAKTGYTKLIIAYRVKKEPVIEVEIHPVLVGHNGNLFTAYPECTYRDGKLISINWESPDA